MTASENFVLRWARLKSGSDTVPKTEAAGDGPRPEAVVSLCIETPSVQQQDTVTNKQFNPASLPSIETISFDTDIRGFLQSHVPAALTRAALRQAWASDPAIRDFIGIAENQWDFNDPTAIPGFGPMRAIDNVPDLVERALGGGDKLTDNILENPPPVESVPPAATGRGAANLDQSLDHTSEMSPSPGGIGNLPEGGQESTAAGGDRFAEEVGPSRNYRSHGSALPR